MKKRTKICFILAVLGIFLSSITLSAEYATFTQKETPYVSLENNTKQPISIALHYVNSQLPERLQMFPGNYTDITEELKAGEKLSIDIVKLYGFFTSREFILKTIFIWDKENKEKTLEIDAKSLNSNKPYKIELKKNRFIIKEQ